MRIVFMLTRGDDFAGTQVHVRDLAAGCRDRGHDAIVLAGGDGVMGDACRERGVPFYVVKHLQREVKPLTDLRALRHIVRQLRRFRPDLLTCHNSKSGILGRIAARMLGIPVLYTAHGWQFALEVPTAKRRMFRAFEVAGAQLGDGIITVCEQDRLFALNYRGFGAHDVHTIHNAMPDVPPELRADPGVEPPRFIMVARTAPQKDHPTLLQAMAGLTDLDWHIDFVGDGPSLDAHRDLAARLGLAERVTFHGFQRDVPQRLARAQGFLLVTNWEGFPYSTLEAMAAGLPVLASDVGGVGEAIRDGVTGFLVPHKDVQAVADRMRQLITSPELRCRMGQAGRELYLSEFTFERMLDKTLQLYESVAISGT